MSAALRQGRHRMDTMPSNAATTKVTTGSRRHRGTVVAAKNPQRSRITNGTTILPNIDGRSAAARRYKDIANAIMVDQGGADRCSETRAQLVRRFAAASVVAEEMEAKLARGEAIDIAEHALLCSTLVRIAQRIGLQRHAKDVTPSLNDYLRERHGGSS